ncbi:MAG: ATP-binding protein [Thermodesulfobacteriota bacterium]|nr:MAG: ATP-binding protein [Thermodesulfobacteriota bacterium]
MQAYPKDALGARLLAMMVLRVVLALSFLGVTAWFQVRGASLALLNFYPLYGVAAAVGLLTILYALLLGRVRNLKLFTYAQVTIDIALATVIVYITGGTESYMHALYPLIVIGAAILLGKRAGFYAASVSSIAYGVLIDLDFYGMLPAEYKLVSPAFAPPWKYVFVTVSTNILAFFTVAYLTGYLAERAARVERELEEKEIDYEKLEALNRQIIENITSGIMTLDDRMRITSFNREAEGVTGYTLRDVYYKDVEEIFPGMIRKGLLAPQGGRRVEERFRKRTGEEIYLGFSISQGQGGEVGRIIIFQDLTRLKQMEEALRRDERMKALGEVSVGIAHEIRNPLASISGSIQLLRAESAGGENRRLMDIILSETDRLNSLITDYLLFAKPAREAERELVDLSAVIDETVRLIRNCPEASGIRIESKIGERFSIVGDHRQLGQVFWNLFLNALHAMEGGGTLTVSARRWPEGGLPDDAGMGFVEVTVSDTGKGIRPEDACRIFDPFFSTKERGTGLGLAIVHRIIESHSGTIEVSSGEGRGAAFRILLPVESEGARA